MNCKTFFACVLIAFAILVAGAVSAADPDTRNPREFFFTQTFGDLPEEMRIATGEGKLGMLLFFESETCGYCKRMLNKVFNQRSVQDWYADRFVSIAIDVFGDVELKDFDGITLPSKIFSAQRKIFATPVVLFIAPNGNEIFRHFGMIDSPQEFLLLGEYIEDEHYFDTEYTVFLTSKGAQNFGRTLTTPATAEDET